MFTELIDGDSAFALLANEWDALAGRGMTDTPFQTLAYQRAWWQHLQPAPATLHTVVVRSTGGKLIGIGCFYLLEGALYFNGCVEETDYLDLIVSAKDAERVWTAVMGCLHTSEFPTWERIDLCNVPEGSLTRTILPQLAAQYGHSSSEMVHEVCPVIQLANTFDEYLDSIDSKQRREISRKLRRADAAGVKLTMVTSADDLYQAVELFLELLQKSAFEKRDWLNNGRRAVFHETAVAALAAGMLQLLFIEVEGDKAAALFNFDYKGRIWVYNSGLDPAAYSALSLGVVITAKAIEKAISDGRQVFDFLRGSEIYKYRFGAQDTAVYRLQVNC